MFPPLPLSFIVLILILTFFISGASSTSSFFERGIVSLFIFIAYVIIYFLFLVKRVFTDSKKDKEEYQKMIREEQDVPNTLNQITEVKNQNIPPIIV